MNREVKHAVKEALEDFDYEDLMGKTIVLQPSVFDQIGKHLIDEYNDFEYFK